MSSIISLIRKCFIVWILCGFMATHSQDPNPFPAANQDWSAALNNWNNLKNNPTFSSIELVINRLLLLATSGENYIVVLNVNITSDEFYDHLHWIQKNIYNDENLLGRISQRFDFGGNNTFFGYAGTFNGALLELIKSLPIVRMVIRDHIAHVQQVTNTQSLAPWGLARISTRLSMNGRSTGPYTFNRRAGSGVDVYILDTGVYVQHSDFHGRARYPSDLAPPGPDKNLGDDNGHGTHVAGIVGSNTYGVAKSVNIIAVKVLGANGRGAWSGVIAGIDYVVRKFKANRRHSIINISISGPRNAALNQAVNAAVSQGVHVIVASGNDGQDACQSSPGSAQDVVSVGASTASDTVADFSNYGACVSINAPGNAILSVGTSSQTASRYMSGTSMASPYVAGAVAVLLSKQTSLVSPATMRRTLVSISTKGALRAGNPGTTDLLYLPSN